MKKKMDSGILLCILFGCLTQTSLVSGQRENMRIVYEWKQLEFDYETAEARDQDIKSGEFLAGQILPIDTDVHYPTKKVFITIPRFMNGIPVTLGTVTEKKLNGNPIIKPYPDWSWHRSPSSCTNKIVSVFRIQVDECDRLWVLDTGKIESNQLCPPQLLVFNLKTDELITKHQLTLGPLDSNSLLVTPVIDTRGHHCSNTFAYLFDCQIFTIFVYDHQRQVSWKIQDKTMYPFPSHGTYNIAGNTFEIMDGILGGALSPYKGGGNRILYYHAMSSLVENWVETWVLRNETYFKANPSLSAPKEFHTYHKKRSAHAAAEAIDSNGIMYFGLLEDLKLACWNTKSEFDSKNIDVIASNPDTLQFPSSVKIVKNLKHIEELWVLTSRFQKVAAGTLNTNEVNFRILAGRTDDLIHGTKCKSPKW